VTGVPESPYKGLAAFEDSELDALLFFGREPEIDAVAANVLASRLTVLYGPSGVGKSSLLSAGVARRLREWSDAPVVVHDAWAEDPEGGLISSVRAECGGLGATAGIVDTVAAAGGELFLLLDQFEEYVLYHGSDGPLSAALPELLRRPGLRVNVLIGIRDDALAELDEFTSRIPELFANLIRLDRLDREEGRAAILGPLARYSELSGETFTAEPALVEAVLDEASTATGVEAPYLQLVLERLWEQERDDGSRTLRLSTFESIGGSRAVIHDHVHRALELLEAPEQVATARVVRQLVTPSGRKVSHEAADLAEYAAVEPAALRNLLEELGRRRIVRAVDGTQGAAPRWEIFHDVLGPPLLAWQQEQRLRDERAQAARQRRRLQVIAAVSLTGLVLVAFLAIFALVQRSNARTQARRASGRELAAQALADLATNPQASVRHALHAAELTPGRQTTSVLRSSLLAMREERVLRLGGSIVATVFAPHGDALLVASSNGRLDLWGGGAPRTVLSHGPAVTAATWSADGHHFAAGLADGTVLVDVPKANAKTIHLRFPITSLVFAGDTLLIASGSAVRLEHLTTGTHQAFRFGRNVDAAALNPNGTTFAVALHHLKSTTAELVDAHTGSVISVLPDQGIRSFAFSPNGTVLASGSYDVTARLWDASTGRQLHVLPHKGHVLQESFSADGTQLVTASSDGAAYVWDVATGQREFLLADANSAINAAAFSPDGSEVATASADRIARLYFSTNGRLLAPLGGATNAVTTVGFDPTGRTLVTGSSDGTARLWDALPAGTLTTIDKRRSPVHSFWLGRDLVTIAGGTAREITPSGHVLHTRSMPSPIVATASRGRHFALLAKNGLVATSWDSAVAVNPDFHVTAIAFTPDGKLLTAQSDGTVMRGGTRLTQVQGPVVGLSASGDRILLRTPQYLAVLTGDGKPVTTIAAATDHATLSPGGLEIATTKGSVAQLWDATTGTLLFTLNGHHSPITALEFSPDGRNLVTVSYDHTGLVWSTKTGNLVHRLIGHFFPIYSVAYSPDGRWIVTASQFTAGLWNAATGQLMFYVGRTSAPLTGAAFNATGGTILTGSLDGTARVYDCEICAPLPKLEQLAAARVRRLGG
jgi:WD40 repeat protein